MGFFSGRLTSLRFKVRGRGPRDFAPDHLQKLAAHAIGSRTLHAFSIGACYARTDTYPTGVYWVVLSLE